MMWLYEHSVYFAWGIIGLGFVLFMMLVIDIISSLRKPR